MTRDWGRYFYRYFYFYFHIFICNGKCDDEIRLIYGNLRKKGKTKKINFFLEDNVIKKTFSLIIFEEAMR